jgi:hypothetical protein
MDSRQEIVALNDGEDSGFCVVGAFAHALEHPVYKRMSYRQRFARWQERKRENIAIRIAPWLEQECEW